MLRTSLIDYLDGNMVWVEGNSQPFLVDFKEGKGQEDAKRGMVTIKQGFYISKYEVTQGIWLKVMDSLPNQEPLCVECPVNNITWDEANDFIEKLDSITGRKYYLPTPEQWTYAANGGTLSKKYAYAGSNDLEEVAWYTSNSEERIHKVGQKKPNELGLYDMSGNVYEWCQGWFPDDCYSYKQYMRSEKAHILKSKPEYAIYFDESLGRGCFRPICGGAWSSVEEKCLNGRVSKYLPRGTKKYIGFRLLTYRLMTEEEYLESIE